MYIFHIGAVIEGEKDSVPLRAGYLGNEAVQHFVFVVDNYIPQVLSADIQLSVVWGVPLTIFLALLLSLSLPLLHKFNIGDLMLRIYKLESVNGVLLCNQWRKNTRTLSGLLAYSSCNSYHVIDAFVFLALIWYLFGIPCSVKFLWFVISAIVFQFTQLTKINFLEKLIP